MRKTIATVACLFFAAALHAEDPPWGEPADGIACRLRVPAEVVPGQAIRATIELKNVSQRTRYLVPNIDPRMMVFANLAVTGPDGKALRQAGWNEQPFPASLFQPIKPGEVKRHEFANVAALFVDLDPEMLHRRGNEVPRMGAYTLTLSYRSPPLPEKRDIGKQIVNGKLVPLYDEGSPEAKAGVWTATAESRPVTFRLRPFAKEDLTVHEWGVFTVFNDAKYANLDHKAEWASMPEFFYRQFPRERLRWAPAVWKKPVIYFYAKPLPLRLQVEVRFREGAPVIWWPAAADPVDDNAGRLDCDKPFRRLQWDAWLGEGEELAGRPGQAPSKEFALPADCWLTKARLPDATPLTVVGSNIVHTKPWSTDRLETERFLYYDGLVPAPSYLRCERVSEDSIALRNRASFDTGPLFVVDRRPKATRFAVIESLKAGSALEVSPAATIDWPASGMAAVRKALLAAGLFAAEADSLLAIWKSGLFLADGVTAFHLLPQREYDRMLPLQIRPAPAAAPVRVGIALHPHLELEPDLAKRAAELIRQLDDPKFAVREQASKALLSLGPLAVHVLQEAKQNATAETKNRLEAILNQVDAAEWLQERKK